MKKYVSLVLCLLLAALLFTGCAGGNGGWKRAKDFYAEDSGNK